MTFREQNPISTTFVPVQMLQRLRTCCMSLIDKPVKLMTDEDSLRQDSLRQDSLKQRVHIVRPVSSARAPKTGARLTEARALDV